MRTTHLLPFGIFALALSGCVADRIDHLGKPPSMAPMENPREDPNYNAVSLPMPAQQPVVRQDASLWQPGARAFFKDQRAGKVGDILTVVINIDESAKLQNTTSRKRDNSETAGLPHLLGLETAAASIMPNGFSPDKLVDLSSAGNSAGDGKIDRKEQIQLQVAALITDQLPNGNFVIAGKQEVRVNFELRELTVQGVIRPEDVSPANTIKYDQIAEARISYGGRGQITDVQQPRYGQQIFDTIFPF
jgi:flagellar L-ring protein precursor FlgH